MDFLSSSLRADRTPSPSFIPRDDDVVELLKSTDFDTRLQTLNRMILLCKRDPDWFSKFTKKGDLIKNVDKILLDDRWEVQHQSLRFLLEAMPSFGTNLEYCMCYVMPNIVPKLGSSKITIRRVTVQVIQTFTRLQPIALPSLLVRLPSSPSLLSLIQKMLINYVHNSPDRLVKHELANEIPALFQPWLKDSNWTVLIDGFTKWMLTTEKEITERIAMVLKKLQVFVGDDVFERVIDTLPSPQQEMYTKNIKPVVLPAGDTASSPIADPSTLPSPLSRSATKSGREMRTRFGIVPTYIGTMLSDEDPNTRATALEKMKQIVEKMTAEEMAKLIPHLHSFFVTVGNVLNDLNFKVVVLALDLLRMTVNRLKGQMEAHLQQVVGLLSRHLGNQKTVVKQILIMTVMDLFRSINPKAVVAVLCPFLEHKNSRVREEVQNMLTAALLVVPSSKMNLSAVANLLVPRLVDPKRRVRLAAFEHLSVLAFSLNGKLDPIMKLVKEYEQKCFEGLTAAVFARLRRGTRPSIRYDGLVEYSTPPITDSSFDVHDEDLTHPDNLDLHWILYANGAKDERSSSPPTLFSTYKSGVKAVLAAQALQHQRQIWGDSESEKDDVSMNSVKMERMKSDDQIARRPTGELKTVALLLLPLFSYLCSHGYSTVVVNNSL